MLQARVESIDPKRVRRSPIRHQVLPEGFLWRTRLVRAALWSVLPFEMKALQGWIDDFRRDAHPSKELEHWEAAAVVFLRK